MIIEHHEKEPVIVGLIETLYSLPRCGAGGLCHIVTDDDNILDDDIKWVIDYCNEVENKNRIEKELVLLICELLLQLTFEQRFILFSHMEKTYDIDKKQLVEDLNEYMYDRDVLNVKYELDENGEIIKYD